MSSSQQSRRGGGLQLRWSTVAVLGFGAFVAGAVTLVLVPRRWKRALRGGQGKHQHHRGGRRPVIVVLGDSLTQLGFDPEHVGWVGRLAHAYSRKADVLNRGFSGYNTRWMKLITPDLFGGFLRRHPPVLVTVWLGANDAAIEGTTQHVPFEEYKAKLKDLVRMTQDLSREVAVILLTPPPVHEVDLEVASRGWAEGKLTRSHHVSKAYGEAAIEAAIETGIPYVDVYEVLEGEAEPHVYQQYLSDGLHLSTAGNERVFEAVMDAIQKYYPYLAPDNLEMQAPDWKDVPAGSKSLALYKSKSGGR